MKMFSLLLVDDDPFEEAVVRKVLTHELGEAFDLVYVKRCSEAMDSMNQRPFDMVLLDNRLTRSITAQLTVPMLKSVRYPAPIVVFSNSLDPDYLQDPAIMDVQAIVDKREIISFLKAICRPYRARSQKHSKLNAS